MNSKEVIEIIIAGATLLGAYFGLPKLFQSIPDNYKRTKIRNKLNKLIFELEKEGDHGRPEHDAIYEAFLKLKNHLWEGKEVIKNKEFLQDQLNKVIAILYEKRKDEYIQEIRDKFQNSYDFDAQSWAYIAIANMNLYRWDNMKEYRDDCLEACRQCVKITPNYGTPRAVMLIVYMIDYVRGKSIDQDLIREMLRDINAGDDTLVSRKTYDYLDQTMNTKGWSKYVTQLSSLYEEEMTTMKNRYEGKLEANSNFSSFEN